MSVIQLTSENFKQEVGEARVPVLVDFWASWCGPCKMMGPVVEQIAQDMGDSARVCKINIDEQPELASQYNVMSIPTFILFKEGKEVKEETGLDVKTLKVISIQDRNKHNKPVYAYGVCKVFVLCNVIGGKFEENIETTETKYFALEEIPDNLAEEKTNKEQIKMCFEAYKDKNWKTQFD